MFNIFKLSKEPKEFVQRKGKRIKNMKKRGETAEIVIKINSASVCAALYYKGKP